jgi:Mrp family chromosome partitioning ATPase
VSDLQCPARFLLVCGPDASLAEELRHERVAAVYVDPPGPGAAALAGALGLEAQALARPIALVDVLERDPGALATLGDLADLHRGETVVVDAEGERGHRLEVALDGDGPKVGEVSRGVGR